MTAAAVLNDSQGLNHPSSDHNVFGPLQYTVDISAVFTTGAAIMCFYRPGTSLGHSTSLCFQPCLQETPQHEGYQLLARWVDELFSGPRRPRRTAAANGQPASKNNDAQCPWRAVPKPTRRRNNRHAASDSDSDSEEEDDDVDSGGGAGSEDEQDESDEEDGASSEEGQQRRKRSSVWLLTGHSVH